MRKSFNGLSSIVISQLETDLYQGNNAFVFLNKNRNRLKVLIWEGDGFSIYYKRLEKGTFRPPLEDKSGVISYDKLLLFLQGLEYKKIRKRKRYLRGIS